MHDLDDLFTRLAKSKFRRRFRLGDPDQLYLQQKGLPIVLEHAEKFIVQRLSAAQPVNDGKQTPFRGHPVFVAQHATATCCRGCLEKWHGIPAGKPLSERDIRQILATIERWLGGQIA